MVLFDESLEQEVKELQSHYVWIVSGGGSGVTAAAIVGVAQASRNSGATFILLGRTELLKEPASWISWPDEKLEQRKLELRKHFLL